MDIRKWVNSVMKDDIFYNKDILDYLIDECHITEIADLYCINVMNEAIEKAMSDEHFYTDVQLFFAFLMARTRTLRAISLLEGLGFDKTVSEKTIASGYDSINKIKKVNYEQLLNIGIEENKAKEFIETMIYSADLINILTERFGDFK